MSHSTLELADETNCALGHQKAQWWWQSVFVFTFRACSKRPSTPCADFWGWTLAAFSYCWLQKNLFVFRAFWCSMLPCFSVFLFCLSLKMAFSGYQTIYSLHTNRELLMQLLQFPAGSCCISVNLFVPPNCSKHNNRSKERLIWYDIYQWTRWQTA